jgi:hypothetical protein
VPHDQHYPRGEREADRPRVADEEEEHERDEEEEEHPCELEAADGRAAGGGFRAGAGRGGEIWHDMRRLP